MCNRKHGSPSSSSHSRKQVRFQEEHLEERFELEISDSDERLAKWMTRADFLAIHSDICQAVEDSICSRHFQEDNDERCFRGLESIASSGRKVQIQCFIQDLLEMQEDYKELGMFGPTGLQNFSENNSRDANERARSMADRDASEARQVYAELYQQRQ